MTKILCAMLLAVPAFALGAPPTDTNPPSANENPSPTERPKQQLSQVDTQALAHQHNVNKTEIQLGKLAQQNGSAAVKKYGQMLAKDHQNADQKVTAFGSKHGVSTMPADAAMTEADKKEMADNMTKLRGMKGADFDREFLNMMVADHEREVTKIEADIGIVDNPDLASLLREIKPMLQKHADEAKKLQQPAAATSMKEP